ncbi:MAG: M6 family metalloprotease domain-containing protein [Paludibacteraceae bacterium]|nr:M6 family metalloprotease domain-containing protein [Paludibacteraceae bacterium]
MTKRTLIIAFIASIALSVSAQELRCPARNKPIVRHQPDGDSVTVILRGDEWKNWMLTTDGWQVRENENGTICYLQQPKNRYKDNNATTSRKQAHDANQRKYCERHWLKHHGVLREPIRQTVQHCPPRILSGQAPTATARKLLNEYMAQNETMAMAIGQRRTFARVPVILVQYTDMPFSFKDCHQQIDSMFNAVDYISPAGHTGSVRQYFSHQSYGQYTPQFDIYGPVSLSHNYAYYGAGSDDKASEMVAEACTLMDDSLDFSQYDLNKDGKVDLVFVVYAGPPASDEVYINRKWIKTPSDLIWPHYSTIGTTYGQPTTFDGKTIYDYEVSAELDGAFSYNPSISGMDSVPVPAGIGIMCHEFGHGLGLPDVYNTAKSSAPVVDEWDIMDQGCYNNGMYSPANYTAYERFFMGWLTPTQISAKDHISMQDINVTGNDVKLICPSGKHNLNGVSPKPTTFYLLENRQHTGNDAYIPKHGLVISKIQYNASNWANNKINTTSTLGYNILGAYPNDGIHYTAINGYPIEHIKESNGVISFQFMGGTHQPLSISYFLEGAQVQSGPTEGPIAGTADITITLTSPDGYPQLTDDNCLYSVEEEGFGEVNYQSSLTNGVLTITIPTTSQTGALQVIVYGPEGPTTNWLETTTQPSMHKFIKGHHLYIIKHGKLYDLLGHETHIL